jgi:hypothetical protein
MHDWDPEKKKIVAIGQGVVDWKKLLIKTWQSDLANYVQLLVFRMTTSTSCAGSVIVTLTVSFEVC